MRNVRYGSFTPARRAALHRASLISAQKRHARRRKIAVGVGVAAVTVGALGTGAYLGHAYVRGLKGGPTVPKVSTSKELDVLRVNARGTNWAHVGKPLTRVAVLKKSSRKRLNYVQYEKRRVQKEKTRVKKNYKQRRRYWRAKPIGG